MNSISKQGHVPLEVDGYPVAPPELALQQVHIYVRHGMFHSLTTWLSCVNDCVLGERTPVRVRMSGPPANIPENWMFCHTARQFRAAVAGLGNESGGASFPAVQSGFNPEELRTRRIVERPDGAAAVGEW